MDIDSIIPSWLYNFSVQRTLETYEGFVDVAIDLSRLNVEHATGGPFGAAIFDTVTGLPISFGVNLVEEHNCSVLHAEIVAIIQAQHALSCYNFSSQGSYLLASSAEPCAMCAGAIPWSGIVELVFAAYSEDVESIGFDEGDKPLNWREGLEARGINVTAGVNRNRACDVLQHYKARNGLIYNGIRPRTD